MTIRSAPPTLETVSVPFAWWLTATPPKLSTGGATWSTAVGLRPMPVTGAETGAPSAVTTIAVERMPAWVGVKVTGMVSVSPWASAAGNAGVGLPATKSALVELTAVTVTERRAVKTTCPPTLLPSVTVPRSTGLLASGWSTGRPIRRPSPRGFPRIPGHRRCRAG